MTRLDPPASARTAMWFASVPVGMKIARSKLGFRTLMDVIPLDATLVKGSHGRLTDDPAQGPVFLSTEPDLVPDTMRAVDVKNVVLRHVFGRT